MGSKSNRSRRYTEEFKRDAVALVRSSGKTVTEVARQGGAECFSSTQPPRFPAAAVLPAGRTVSPAGGRRHVQQPFGDLPVLHERDP
ncbi:transposase [Streptomyces canus]|uniref:transposase n=1 Tax=Streptomyces canus TaxID=58343 RepID=UPI003592F590